MARLNSRQIFIPGGFRFVQPEIRWQSTPWASFDSIVNSLIQARKANPAQVAKFGWATDYPSVANEVDNFNAQVCLAMGWTDYVTGDAPAAPPPKAQALHDQQALAAAAGRIKKLWSGVKTLNAWLDSGDPPVSQSQSNIRASVCVECPHNGKGDWTRWFTVPASEVIKRQVARLHERNISTALDDRLVCCEPCLCPLRVKVQTPIKYIKEHTDPAVLAELSAVPQCWVPQECK